MTDLQPTLSFFDGGWLGPRIGLSLKIIHEYPTFPLTLTSKGVYRFAGQFGIKTDPTGKPRFFRGSCDIFDDCPVVSTEWLNGVQIDCESDGNVALIVAYDSHGDRNCLLRITREGVSRYRFISTELLNQLGFPYDEYRSLKVLR